MNLADHEVIWYRTSGFEIVELRRGRMTAKEWGWVIRQIEMKGLQVWTTDPREQGATA